MIPKPHSASLVFYVSDIARTEAFYRDVLGLDVTRQEGAEPFWLTADFEGGFQAIFFQMEASAATRRRWSSTLWAVASTMWSRRWPKRAWSS